MSKMPRRRCLIEPLELRLLMTVGELVRNGAIEGTVASTDWARGSAWQAGSLGHTNYHGGTGYAYNGTSGGSYVHNTTGAAGEMYQELSIPAGTSNPTLQFWTKITTEETTTTTAFDTMAVQIKNAGGTVLQTLTTLSNLNAGSTSGPYTNTGKYHLHTFNLSAYTGQTIRVNFKVTTDAAKGTMFRVDDVSLAPPVPVVPGTSGQVVGYMPDYRYSYFAQVDLNLVTHLNYFSVGFASNGTLSAPSATFNSHLDTVVAAAHAKGVGVSITTGPGQPYAAMGASATARAKLVSDLKAYVLAHNLDGVDIDWEPPARGADQVNYGLLIDDLYAAFNPIGKKITAAVNPWTKEIPVDASKKMSWINVMCYDFDYANHSTYAAATDGMNQWFNYGVAKDKLTMGVPFYGRYGTSWSDTHSKTYNTILNDYKAVTGNDLPPNVDSYTDAGGFTTYFNGITTLENKMAYVRDSGYAGAMIWELGQDHWDGAASPKYDSFSVLPVVSSMLRPPTWLTPATGSTFHFVNKQFFASSGTVTFSGDIFASISGAAISIASSATAILGTTQQIGSLSIASGGKLDMKDKDLIIDYTGASPLGSWNGSAYTGISGLIQSGRNGDLWNGSGIVTSMTDARSGLTTVGFDEASSSLGLSGSQTTSWGGKTVDATSVIIKYTWGGDADLDGDLDGDDYFYLDSHVLQTGTVFGFNNGDYNLDGELNGDDYWIIDSNILQADHVL